MLVCAAALFPGCGDPKSASYVDPNPDSIFAGVGADSIRQPLAEHGADSLERASAIGLMRGDLAAARILQPTDAKGAADLVGLAITEALPVFEPRLQSQDPALRGALRTALEGLHSQPPAGEPAYGAATAAITGKLADQVSAAVIPQGARQDPGFRAIVVADQLVDAGLRYEEATQGSERIELPDSYREAYGLLLDARTRGITTLPAASRDTVRTRIAKVADRWLPGPTPPTDDISASQVLDGLSSVSDLVTASQDVDATPPPPDPNTPDQLRLLQRAAATAVQAARAGDSQRALDGLATAYRTHLTSAAHGLAAITPEELAHIEGLVAISIPQAISAGDSSGQVDALATELDAAIDDAVSLVESELDLQRESESQG